MTGPEGNSEFCFPRISISVSLDEVEGNIEILGKKNKIHCFPKNHSLSDLIHSLSTLAPFSVIFSQTEGRRP